MLAWLLNMGFAAGVIVGGPYEAEAGGSFSAGAVAGQGDEEPSMRARPIRVECYEQAAPALMARVLGHGGEPVTQATITDIAYKVYDLGDDADDDAEGGAALIDEGALSVAAVVFDELQTGPVWKVDSSGYNVLVQTEAGWFPHGPTSGRRRRVYRVEIFLTPASGPPIPVVYSVRIVRVIGT